MASVQTGADTAATATEYVDVLLYSDDAATRAAVMEGVGRRAAKGLPIVRWTETATGPAAVNHVKGGDFSLVIADGEAARVGGMALAHQLKIEVYQCPPVIVLTARPQDAWLATYADADATVGYPLDPHELQEAVATLLRRRLGR